MLFAVLSYLAPTDRVTSMDKSLSRAAAGRAGT